jgi:threonine/homoserine/homoserine lactone efflux protein
VTAETANFLCFLGASMALTIAPGPDNLFVLSQGLARGRKPAVATALGMCCGVSVHTSAAALGISALFYSSALAFNIVKFAGAAYLLFLAWKTLREPSSARLSQADERPLGRLFQRGFLMNVLNPKVAMFFLAFLPQFVTPDGGPPPVQMFGLGLAFMLQAACIFCAIAWLSGGIGRRILANPKRIRWLNWLAGGVFISLGARLALAQK